MYVICIYREQKLLYNTTQRRRDDHSAGVIRRCCVFNVGHAFTHNVMRYYNIKQIMHSRTTHVTLFGVWKKICSLTLLSSCSSLCRWYGFQPDVWNGTRLPGHGPRCTARLHCPATTGKRPAARVTKAGQSVRIHGLPRQVNLQITYFIHL